MIVKRSKMKMKMEVVKQINYIFYRKKLLILDK